MADAAPVLGLVIQGPIRSRAYDCRPGLDRLIEEHLAWDAAMPIVVSTWEGEEYQPPDRRVVVLQSRPVTGRDPLNRRKQWTSTHEGLKFLRNNTAATHALKCRTDLYLPTAVAEFVRAYYADPAHRCRRPSLPQVQPILFPDAFRPVPFWVGDWFFAGALADMSEVFGSALRFRGVVLQQTCEIDLLVKYLKTRDGAFPLGGPLTSFPFDESPWLPGYRRRLRAYWDRLVEEAVVDIFPRALFSMFRWRGEALREASPDGLGRRLAEVTVDRYLDFAEELELRRRDPEAYGRLPADVAYLGTAFNVLHAARHLGLYLAHRCHAAGASASALATRLAAVGEAPMVRARESLRRALRRRLLG